MKEMFEAFGEVSNATLITDKFSGRSKGFGFVEMPDDSCAEDAIKALNGNDMKGRAVVVNPARPKQPRN